VPCSHSDLCSLLLLTLHIPILCAADINDNIHTATSVNLQRLIWNAQKTFKIDVNAETSLNPADVVKSVKALCAKLIVVTGSDKLSEEAQHNATLMFHILVRRYVACHTYTSFILNSQFGYFKYSIHVAHVHANDDTHCDTHRTTRLCACVRCAFTICTLQCTYTVAL
jgi:RNA polymerase Rpb1, domain 6